MENKIIKENIEFLSSGQNGYSNKIKNFFKEYDFSQEEKVKIKIFFKGEENILKFINYLIDNGIHNLELKKYILLYIDLNNLLNSGNISAQSLKEIEQYFGGDIEKTIIFLDFINKVGIGEEYINSSVVYILNSFGIYINDILKIEEGQG